MITATNHVVTLTAAGFAIACSWCTPRAQLVALSQQYPAKVSHTICPACLALMEAERATVRDVERSIEETQRTRRAA